MEHMELAFTCPPKDGSFDSAGDPGRARALRLQIRGRGISCLLFFVLITLMLILSACAGFDVSVLDTAETLGKGQYEIAYAISPGIDVVEWSDRDEAETDDPPSTLSMNFLELRYGIEDDIDGSLRIIPSAEGISGKLLFKKQLFRDEEFSSAIGLGAGAMIGNRGYWDSLYGSGSDRHAFSAQAQYMLTRNILKHSSITLAGRANMQWIYSEQPGYAEELKEFYHGGLRVVLSRTFKGLTMMVEGGVEVPFYDIYFGNVYPWGGMKIAVKLNKKNQ